MNSKLLKWVCAIKISVCLVLLCSLSVTLYYLSKSNAYVVQYNANIMNEIRKLSFKIVDVHKHEAMLNNSGSLWQEISNSNIYSTSYEENLGTLISDLCKKYYLFNSEISISNPEVIGDTFNKQYISVIKSRVKLKFASISDEQVFLFINAIRHDISGYVKIINVSIGKDTEITNEILQSALKGESVSTVRGRIVFDLYSIVGKFINES
ncbi:hypothetical protein EDL79_00785 [Ehrlichia ruminantium]|uniref:Uncharacterized protein n=1 Tax=Ehrlichia ruminantium TaxID=779 RepID=A0AAE6UI74_EHRRU|nr:hypothetical protein [Ehrlichia ruminantium]QGR02227.1 hypothetical protein EDL81_00785 [Ehrlichia ruminantium]QGR03149.1 hypothetical protein EDL80_00785 [Ehrlichia ruminantium]QGR04074.1 hypothetical protein EDL79_00785 [Ehrlichia ruminantium]